MSKYETLSKSSDPVFRRVTGVKRDTFKRMVYILDEECRRKRSKGGRPSKLTIEDMLLVTLEYLREYRTYLHIAKSHGISEITAFKTIRWVENTLVAHPDFSLPGRKALKKSDMKYEVILVDATETPIERPKKTAKLLLREEKEAHSQKSTNRRAQKPQDNLHGVF
jgi:hypothetical protein